MNTSTFPHPIPTGRLGIEAHFTVKKEDVSFFQNDFHKAMGDCFTYNVIKKMADDNAASVCHLILSPEAPELYAALKWLMNHMIFDSEQDILQEDRMKLIQVRELMHRLQPIAKEYRKAKKKKT
jgi:hypothetical protein